MHWRRTHMATPSQGLPERLSACPAPSSVQRQQGRKLVLSLGGREFVGLGKVLSIAAEGPPGGAVPAAPAGPPSGASGASGSDGGACSSGSSDGAASGSRPLRLPSLRVSRDLIETLRRRPYYFCMPFPDY